MSMPHCTTDPSWGTFNAHDCDELDRAFWRADIHNRGNPTNTFEWLSADSLPVTGWPFLQTPRRFTQRK